MPQHLLSVLPQSDTVASLSAAFTFSRCGAWEAFGALNAMSMQNGIGAKITIVMVRYHTSFTLHVFARGVLP